MPVNVPGFYLTKYCNTAKSRQNATTSSVAVSSSRKAGGVAIYHNIKASPISEWMERWVWDQHV